jgi:F-type H+-transporting ATPase subunit O
MTEEEEVPAYTPPPVEQKAAPVASKIDFSQAGKAQENQVLDQALFQSFSVGDVKVVQTTEDHKPPIQEDTIEGRYAGVLFSTASQQECLYDIYEDITYIKGLYNASDSFKSFTQNAGVGKREMTQFNASLESIGTFNPLTIKFLEILADNKRLTFIGGIADRYIKLYKTLNKEEKITIISAETLSSEEQGEVLAALKANPLNAGKEFTLEFTIDETIRGGLQMYTETEFMDMSLASRLEKVRSEVSRMIE